jgi:Skp family chaperone for outer membrane proteins
MHLRQHLKNNLFFTLLFLISLPVPAQKIGFADLEMLLWFMPGYLGINDTLETDRLVFQEKIDIKQRYAKSLLEEYYTGKAVMRPEQVEFLERQLASLTAEIAQAKSDAETRLEIRKQKLQAPFVFKVDSVSRCIARDLGYSYILNHSNAAQVSNILFGPDEHNLMREFALRLGFRLPENYTQLYRNAQKE